MIQRCKDWPTVLPNDDGIRPAGEPDECFYCHQKVGKKHGPNCVCISQKVRAIVIVDEEEVATFEEYVPYVWDIHDCEFHWNGSSWCSDNALDERLAWKDTPKAREALAYVNSLGEDNCSCHYLTFEFDEVIDHGPFITINENPPHTPEFTEKEVRP